MAPPPTIRPPTPQALLHRAPTKTTNTSTDPPLPKPKKYIILLLAPTSVTGKVHIATAVSRALSCPLFHGDSLHESSAKAAAVGASRSDDGSGRARYERMWLGKMTRTGLLFPEESRPANEGFAGVGGGEKSASASTSWRGSGSSVSSMGSFGASSAGGATASSVVEGGSSGAVAGAGGGAGQYVHRSVFAVPISREERGRGVGPALMVLTHPALEAWHRDAVRKATGEYGIGVVFVPLFETGAEHGDEVDGRGGDGLPVLRRLDPRMVSEFTSFDALGAAAGAVERGKKLRYGEGREGSLEEEMVLEVDVRGSVEEIIEEVVRGVRDVMFA